MHVADSGVPSAGFPNRKKLDSTLGDRPGEAARVRCGGVGDDVHGLPG